MLIKGYANIVDTDKCLHIFSSHENTSNTIANGYRLKVQFKRGGRYESYAFLTDFTTREEVMKRLNLIWEALKVGAKTLELETNERTFD